MFSAGENLWVHTDPLLWFKICFLFMQCSIPTPYQDIDITYAVDHEASGRQGTTSYNRLKVWMGSPYGRIAFFVKKKWHKLALKNYFRISKPVLLTFIAWLTSNIGYQMMLILNCKYIWFSMKNICTFLQITSISNSLHQPLGKQIKPQTN